MTIQERVLSMAKSATFPSGEFAIAHMQIEQYAACGDCFSYKQVRDALYRMREYNDYKHVGKGVYQWLTTGTQD